MLRLLDKVVWDWNAILRSNGDFNLEKKIPLKKASKKTYQWCEC
jgi:hypothetical protein